MGGTGQRRAGAGPRRTARPSVNTRPRPPKNLDPGVSEDAPYLAFGRLWSQGCQNHSITG